MIHLPHEFTPRKYQTKKEYNKQYRIDHKEQIAKKDKLYRIKNKKRISIQKKKYYKENIDIITARNKQYYYENHQMFLDKRRKRRKKIKDFIDNYKLRMGCQICGYHKCLTALEFHHEGNDKQFMISQAVAQFKSIKSIQKEMDKCTVLCANCHRELHENDTSSA